jgi:peroxiredoxin
MRIRLTLLAIATAATIALAGCGNDPGTSENASGETTPATTQPAEPSETSESPETSPSASKKPDAEQAPTPQSLDFTTTTVDGKPFEGASLAGKPTVLWFWAAWCPKCRGSASAYKQAADQFGDQVNLVGVAGKSDVDAMKGFISDYGLSGITHLADDNDPLWAKYGITYQHQYVVIDKAGRVVHTGELSERELTDRLSDLAA